MTRFRGRLIIDVGAGQGHVTQALGDRGHAAVGIDVRTDGSYAPVLCANGSRFPYPVGCVVLFCRPCHGVFVESSITRAVQCGAWTVLYAGLRANVCGDLGWYRRRFKRADVVGQKGEFLYEWEKVDRR
jgi:hypothetical protein